MAQTEAWAVETGQGAPAFNLPSTSGADVGISDFRGKPVIVYFYPKNDTPGCTLEAKEFQASLSDLEKENAVVLGISADGIASHCQFAGKYSLGFHLLSDEQHEVAQAYGVWVEKNRYGRKYWGIERTTFLIDADGNVARVWRSVKPEGHAKEVLEAVRSL